MRRCTSTLAPVSPSSLCPFGPSLTYTTPRHRSPFDPCTSLAFLLPRTNTACTMFWQTLPACHQLLTPRPLPRRRSEPHRSRKHHRQRNETPFAIANHKTMLNSMLVYCLTSITMWLQGATQGNAIGSHDAMMARHPHCLLSQQEHHLQRGSWRRRQCLAQL